MGAPKRKIGLIFATGTVMSSRQKSTVLFVDNEADIEPWMKEVPELNLIADIDPIFFLSEDSSISVSDIRRLGALLDAFWDGYDGFVVLVRADSLLMTSNLLSYMLRGFGKPIVFTGAISSPRSLADGMMTNLSKKYSSFGLKSNIINAVQAATKNELIVPAIMYGNRLIKPSLAVRSSAEGINIFESANDSYLGKIEFSIRISPDKNERKIKYDCQPVASDDVMVVDSLLLTPEKIDSHPKGPLVVLVRENEVLDRTIVGKLSDVSFPVVLYNQWFVPSQKPLVSISGITPESFLAKVVWLAGQPLSKRQFEELLSQNLIGEFYQ